MILRMGSWEETSKATGLVVDQEAGDEFVHALARGLDVLKAFDRANDRMTIAEVGKAANLTRAGARRILLTLQNLGYVHAEGRHFSLTARVLELGQGFLAKPIWEVSRLVLHSLAGTINETVSVGVLDGEDVVYTVRVRSSRMLQLELGAGARLPAHASSTGRVLLAALPPAALEQYLRRAKLTPFTTFTVTDPEMLRKRLDDVRKQGWCQIRDEMEEGITGVAVPLVDPRSGKTVAALNASTHSERTSSRKVKSVFVPLLFQAAEAIQAELKAR